MTDSASWTHRAIPPPRLILASASPRRRELLARLGLPFNVVIPEVAEHEATDADPRAMVLHNAALKAGWVAARHPAAFVLGADTTVCLDDFVLNKPADPAAARAMLRRLAGRTHTVHTGLVLRRARDGLELSEAVASEVTFKPLDEDAITRYLRLVNPLDKAGAYAIQEGTDLIIAGWRGSYTNIVGLPLDETKQILTRGGLYRN
ncbi:MAG: septum formation protein Maf [Verrucomicrobia bacterium RIFCSPLOWO2_12_FULL_64_8]|nr:MAG: septum formation protein Maf [Verrucomicrobia bacterium RIFCSPLOWO2_12_FULL_64_8]